MVLERLHSRAPFGLFTSNRLQHSWIAMASLFQTVTSIEPATQNILRERAYGLIEVRDQRLHAIYLKPYPKLISIAEVRWSNLFRRRSDAKAQTDRVLLYYNQPLLHRNFLALRYLVSDYKSTLASIAVCLSVLDYVAMSKGTDAIVSEIYNKRIKDRHLAHFGWEQHLHQSRRRHWIKRFYGEYPDQFLFQEIARTEQPSVPKVKTPPMVVPNMDSTATNPSHVVH